MRYCGEKESRPFFALFFSNPAASKAARFLGAVFPPPPNQKKRRPERV